MTRRKILDLTSVKKRDNRLLTTNLRINNGNTPEYLPGPAQLNSANGLILSVHVPTAMDRSFQGLQGGTYGTIPSYREKADVYMKGYKESYHWIFADATPWRHRRILFTLKGSALLTFAATSGSTDAQANFRMWSEQAPRGWTRTMNNIAGTNAGSKFVAYMFEGINNTDWRDIFTAKVDSTHITLLSDKIRYMKSDNDTVHSHVHHTYQPLEKRFVYADEEAGDNSNDNLAHVDSKIGMGDLYVVDLIACVNPGTGIQAQVDVSSTLYWHEK